MNETIAAVATPFGQGALAVIRLSGVEALPVAGQALGQRPARELELVARADAALEPLHSFLKGVQEGRR